MITINILNIKYQNLEISKRILHKRTYNCISFVEKKKIERQIRDPKIEFRPISGTFSRFSKKYNDLISFHIFIALLFENLRTQWRRMIKILIIYRLCNYLTISIIYWYCYNLQVARKLIFYNLSPEISNLQIRISISLEILNA